MPQVENLDVSVSGTSATVQFSYVTRLVSYNITVTTATEEIQTINQPDVTSQSIGTTISKDVVGLNPGVAYNFTVDIAVESHNREINTATATQSAETLG